MAVPLTTPSFWKHAQFKASRPNSNWLRVWARQRIDRALAELLTTTGKLDGQLLELGCAPGRMLERIHRVSPALHLNGLDYESRGVAATRNWLKQSRIEATVHHGDFRTAMLEPLFDVVFSAGLIEHFDDPVDALRDHVRFCCPGGYVIILVPNYATPVVKGLLRAFNPQSLTAHNLDIMRPDTLGSSLKESGLLHVQTGRFGAPRVSPRSSRPIPVGTAYNALATSWNLVASLIPFDFFWQSTIWGIGQRRTTFEG